LHELCRQAARRGMAVVVDAVLNHLSNEPRYVRLRGDRIISAQYPNFCARDLAGVHRLGRGRGLPLLDHRSPWVRSQLRRYLHDLYELGVRGFRFDSAKHMPPQLFSELLRGLPPVLCFGELVYARASDYPPDYWQSMRAYDFPLAASMARAFAPGADLGRLLSPDALWGPLSVPFVNGHDLVKNRRGFAHFRVADPLDRRLAYAYMLARGEGCPLVYGADLVHREVKAGIQFYRACAGLPLRPLEATREALVFARGENALAAINKGGWPHRVSARVRPGLYQDLVTGQRTATSGGVLFWTLPGRSALLLQQVT
jgi:alpha-amylase